MTSATTALGVTHHSRRLSVLPAMVGAAAVIVLVIGGFAAGLDDGGGSGLRLIVLSAVMVLSTVISGHPAGLYLGLALFIGSGLAGDDDLTPTSLAIVGASVILAHEAVRFSLDARRPTRFGPGVLRRTIVRTIVVAGAVAALGPVLSIIRGESYPAIWLPIGLALAGTPLFIRHGLDRFVPDGMASVLGRFSIGTALWIGTVAVATVAATARSGIVFEGGTTPQVSTTPTTAPPPPLDDPGVFERGLGVLLLLIAMIVAGILYAGFKRPEVSFELDELDLSLDETSLGLANPAQTDIESEPVQIDEQELLDLLDELALDIGSERDPGRAIRFAYANIERRLGALTVVRADSETEQEFLARALPSLGNEGSAMVELTDLFERARFGDEPMSEATRARALTAVEALRRATTSVPDTEPTSSNSGGAG